MNSNKMRPQVALSMLCLALLTACGDGPSMLDDDQGAAGFTGVDKSKLELPSTDRAIRVPTVTEFIHTMNQSTEYRNDNGLAGQQNSPTVVMNDDNGNGVIDTTDRTHFNSPGITSVICSADECPGFSGIQDKAKDIQKEADEANQRITGSRKEVTEAQEDLDTAKTNLAKSTDVNQIAALKSAVNDAQNKKAEADKALRDAIAAAGDFAQKSKNLVKDTPLNAPKVQGKVLVMQDINGNYYTEAALETVDRNRVPGFIDAGTAKIDYIRTRQNGITRVDTPHGGVIGREFNGVLTFAKDETSYKQQQDGTLIQDPQIYISTYFRNPSTAGFSYQTFGAFDGKRLHTNRGLGVGFQSIGSPTPAKAIKDTPNIGGWANYNGIATAYYNNAQVTMRNKIHADFTHHKLYYETVPDSTFYHTFENIGHVVEQRKDLSLQGEGSWYKDVNSISGKIRAQNGLEGNFTGRFYGPNAEEVGGVFGLQGTVKNQPIQYVGGFGASRE